MKTSSTTSAQIGHSSYLAHKADARLAHQKRLMHSMTGTFDLSQLAEAERLVDALSMRLAKLRIEHELLLSKS